MARVRCCCASKFLSILTLPLILELTIRWPTQDPAPVLRPGLPGRRLDHARTALALSLEGLYRSPRLKGVDEALLGIAAWCPFCTQ